MRFDAANGEDPNRETVDGRARPKELVYAERMSSMLLAPLVSSVMAAAPQVDSESSGATLA